MKGNVKFLIMLALLLIMTAVIISPQAQAPTLSVSESYQDDHASNGKIAFQRTLTDASGRKQQQIFTMNPDGSDVTQLTFSDCWNEYPRWSPDGKMIAFDSNRTGTYQIYIIYGNGYGQKRITHGKYNYQHPSWSPDGTKIICTGGPEHNGMTQQIYIMNADGSNLRLLVSGGSSADWSPDGTRIVFQCCNNGAWSTITPTGGICVINIDGTGKTSLFITHTCCFEPHWSPDGKKILFSQCVPNYGQSMYIMRADGSHLINFSYLNTTINNGCYWGVCWSPDGKKIAFTHNGLVYVMNAEGNRITQLTDGQNGQDVFPSWQPIYRANQ